MCSVVVNIGTTEFINLDGQFNKSILKIRISFYN